MSNRKQPQPTRHLFELTPGVTIEQTQFTGYENIGGTEIHADIGWEDGKPVIERLTVTRPPGGEIRTTVLRSISLPSLVENATNQGVKLWDDAEGTVPFIEARKEGESLEQWATRLYGAAIAKRIPTAEYVAEVQGITVATANQRLVVARKMGLMARPSGAQ